MSSSFDTPLPVRRVMSWAEAEKLNDELLEQPIVALDSEWYNYDKTRHNAHNGLAACLTFSYRSTNGVERIYLHNYGESEGNIFALQPFLQDGTIAKIGHNCPSDFHIFANHGITTRGYRWDMMVAIFLTDQTRGEEHDGYDLKACATDFLGRKRHMFNRVFGSPKLRADGQPYATGQLIVPSMDEIVAYQFERLVEYATNDPWDDWSLYELFRPKLEKTEWLPGKTYWDFFTKIEARVTEDLLCHMEREGMLIDPVHLAASKERCLEDMEKYKAEALEWAGCQEMNINSDVQLRDLLFGQGMKQVYKGKKLLFEIPGKAIPYEEFYTPSDYTKEGNLPKVGAASLAKVKQWGIENNVDLSGLSAFISYSKADKQLGTYLEGLVEKSRPAADGFRVLHSRVNQIGASSGRWSSSGPNLQNITVGKKDIYEIRKAFVAPKGHLVIDFDFGQLEYRLLAHYTQDPKLIKAFIEGWDLHSLTCYNINKKVRAAVDAEFGEFTVEAGQWIADNFPNERKDNKTLNFEIIYGVGFRKLAEQLEITLDAGKKMIDGWFSGYAYVKPWMARLLHEAREKGFIRTLAGRYRYPSMRKLNHKEHVIRGHEERSIVNAKIQGSATDVCKRAMFLVEDWKLRENYGYKMVMQVHDEVVAYCPNENVEEVKEILKTIPDHLFAKPLRVPLVVSVGSGPNWAEAK